MRKYLIFLLITFFQISLAYELNTLIDAPTAGILQKGESEINAKLYKNNGLVIGNKIGLFPRFMFGVNYGAEQIVGNKNPTWHNRVEFCAKFRITDESTKMPAIAIGYNSQGHGEYHRDAKRFDIKSKGFYGVASKNFLLFGNLGFHLGLNYSLEGEKKDEDLNFFAGVDKTIGDVVVLMAEYDPAINDNEEWIEQSIDENIKGLGRGYLNGAVSFYFTESLSLKVSFYDLLENRIDTEGCDRTLTLLYNMSF